MICLLFLAFIHIIQDKRRCYTCQKLLLLILACLFQEKILLLRVLSTIYHSNSIHVPQLTNYAHACYCIYKSENAIINYVYFKYYIRKARCNVRFKATFSFIHFIQAFFKLPNIIIFMPIYNNMISN